MNYEADKPDRDTIALVADAVSLGEAGVTRRIFNDERAEREIEAARALADVLKASGKPKD